MDYNVALASAINEVEAGSDLEIVEQCCDHTDASCLNGVRNELALRHCLNQIHLPEHYPWIETLSITHNQTISVDPDDDLEREVKFYEFTLNSVNQALNRLDQTGTPYRRPVDFFAEMVKSDDHMARIKRKLLHEAAAIEKASENKRVKEQKVHAKEAAAKKKLEKATLKKASVKAINDWKKDAGKHQLTAESFDAAMAKAEKLVRKQKKPVPAPTISKKRQFKNEKFGSGKPRLGKRNNMTVDVAPAKKKSIAKKVGKRPGKVRRAQKLSSIKSKK